MSFYHIILQHLIYQMFYNSILYIKIIYLPKTSKYTNAQSMAVATTQEPTTTATTTATTTTTATNYIHNHQILQQILNPKTSKKKKTQNLQQNSNPTDQSMKKLNQPSAVRSAKAKATKYQIPIKLRFRSRRTYPFSWFSPSNKTQIR